MNDLWKRARRQPEREGNAESGWMGLSGPAMVELVNRADSIRFEAGENLLEQHPDMLHQLVLVRRGALKLSGLTTPALTLEAGAVLNRLSAQGMAATDLTLGAVTPGQLLVLSSTAFDQLHETTQAALLAWGHSFAARLSAQLLEANRSLQQRCQQLSDLAWREGRLLAAGLESTELMFNVIGRMPRLPVSSLELLQRLLDEDSTRAQVVDLVREDPAMTATLLKVINSPAYGFERDITDLSHAITLLGFEGVYQIIMAETLRKSLPDSDTFRHSHERSVMLSYIAFALAQLTGRGRPAELATIALLQDIGRVVLALMQRQQPACRELIRRVPVGVPGAGLLQAWSLPEPVWQVVALQHYPARVPPSRLPRQWCSAVALLHVAQWLLDGQQSRTTHAPYIDLYLEQLGVSSQSFEQLWQQLVPLLRQRRNALPATLRTWIV
ncbi:HDOD domain-containing protein [Marinobacterium weihaiense]|uniref:HDOD domain-containing protein n=1 Tax=Marinobacterium weihaiense TaxID=2851016 RepID=A0ABS6MAV2_9GAMM|nr:HDOD domain-containing protein [Marinobacterium weihaiense]MBV0933417.1 HDOD domain-containing protein [Marinobacterium weihaiense]